MREGQPAPDFQVADHEGRLTQLSDFRGKRVVLFFFPRAGTSGCTQEVREFRAAWPKFRKLGIVVLGASPDSVRAQKRFQEVEELPFPLLADEARLVAASYGVMKEKNMYGRTVVGVERTTLLIGPDGVIKRIWSKVKPEGHADEILRELRERRALAAAAAR